MVKLNVEGKRRKLRPKKRWLDTNENDIRAVGVYVGYVENRDECRFRTRVANPK
jgi:hypothetical protein